MRIENDPPFFTTEALRSLCNTEIYCKINSKNLLTRIFSSVILSVLSVSVVLFIK